MIHIQKVLEDLIQEDLKKSFLLYLPFDYLGDLYPFLKTIYDSFAKGVLFFTGKGFIISFECRRIIMENTLDFAKSKIEIKLKSDLPEPLTNVQTFFDSVEEFTLESFVNDANTLSERLRSSFSKKDIDFYWYAFHFCSNHERVFEIWNLFHKEVIIPILPLHILKLSS